MNSGSAVPTDPVDSAKAQQVYDAVVQGVGCAGQADTLQCLREAEYQVSKPASGSRTTLLSRLQSEIPSSALLTQRSSRNSSLP